MLATKYYDFLFLMETKCKVDHVNPFFRAAGFVKSFGIDAIGSSGGLWVGWKNNSKVECISVCSNFIILLVNEYAISSWYLVLFYGEPNFEARLSVFNMLGHWLISFNKPYIILGDFNQVEYKDDKFSKKKGFIQGAMQFSKWKIDHNLIDIPYKGPRFTWCNNRKGLARVYERIDKAYGSEDWFQLFPNTGLNHYPIQISDHAPIELDFNLIKLQRRRPYKVDSWSLENGECLSLIRESWNIPLYGSPQFCLARKLSILRGKIKKWSLDRKAIWKLKWDNFDKNLESAMAATIASGDELFHEKVNEEVTEFAKASSLYWKQRAKMKWNVDGDTNTKFFFNWVKGRAGRNFISCIKDTNREWIHDQEIIGERFQKFFSNLFNPETLANASQVTTPHLSLKIDPSTKDFSIKKETSVSWGARSIMHGLKVIIPNISWKISPNSDLHIWNSRWIDGEAPPRVTRFGFSPPPSMCEFKIKDLILPSLKWNEDLINELFPDSWGEKIKAIPICPSIKKDYLFWAQSNSGEYTTKSGYAYNLNIFLDKYGKEKDGVRINNLGRKFCKSNLWRLRIPERWKILLWKIITQSLPVGAEFKRRNITTNWSCPLCNNSESLETTAHLFRDCEVTRRLWAGCPLGIRAECNISIPVEDWIINWIKYLDVKDAKGQSSISFISIIWATWHLHIPRPSEGVDTFESFFGISRKTFKYICALVKEEMSAKIGHFSFSNGKHLTLQDQIAVALRRLSSGDSLASVGSSFGMHNSTVSQVTWHFVESMEKNGLQHLQWPASEEMMEIKSKFEKIGGFPNCVGAIDTTHICMCLPFSDSSNKIWLDRQKTHSMLLQAVVDPNMRFRDVVTGYPGKLSDSTVLKSSSFFTLCHRGKRLNGKACALSDGSEIREYIVGDSGFPLLPWLLTPYTGKSLQEPEVDFNRRHFATRMIAKRALARLKQMWKIINGMMWRPDKHKLPRIILVCCMLHNIVIDMKDNIQDEMPLCHDHDEGYRQQLCESADLTASEMRQKLSLYFSGNLPS
ncbi:hypothetical protein KSS87_022415 [Heliosperma pusillum]|nr:hypothetical protein KSS87_022415 [Heliosperma pusillum]